MHAGGIAIRLALDYLGRVRAPSSAAGRRAASGTARRWARRGARAGGARPRGRRAVGGAARRVTRAGGARLRDRQALRQPRSPGSPSSQGSALVYLGELDRGLALLDEASTSALIGELDPFVNGRLLRRHLELAGRGDFERARQWTKAANKWCDVENTHGFPGGVPHPPLEILWLGGQWEAAGARRSTRAPTRVIQPGHHRRRLLPDRRDPPRAGRLRQSGGGVPQGERARARAAARTEALLRLKGKVDEAAAALRRSLGDEERDPVTRARRLPAQIEVSLAIGEVESAKWPPRLEEITERFEVGGERTPARRRAPGPRSDRRRRR